MGETFVVVSDREGFVGAFTDIRAAQAALADYGGIPFVYGEWPLNEGAASDIASETAAKDEGAGAASETANESAAKGETLVWILPYTANKAVACASVRKSDVESAQKALIRLELVPADDISFWTSEMGAVLPAAKRRLDEVLAVQDAFNDTTQKDTESVDRFLDFASQGKTPAEESRRNNILGHVVPRELALENKKE